MTSAEQPITAVEHAAPVPMDAVATPEATVAQEAPPAPAPVRQTTARGMAAELAQTLLLTLVIFFGVRAVVQRFRVDGLSMEPTLHNGEYLWVNKAAYFHVEQPNLSHILPGTHQGSATFVLGGPRRGDVAVFRPPREADKDFVKRVIGLPGDTILIKNGQVFVNGQHLDEPYLRFLATYNYPTNGQPLMVPDRSYFVLGDNRPNSSDSHFGWVVPADNLVGRVLRFSWPSLAG